MKAKLRITYDTAVKLGQYLRAGHGWPEWECPVLEIEIYDADPDIDTGESELIIIP